MTTAPKTPITKSKRIRTLALAAAMFGAGFGVRHGTQEETKIGAAHADFVLTRADGTVEKWDADNVKTKSGIDLTFAEVYGSGSAAALDYVACSNDTLTETSDSTTLSSEITTNGLARAQGTYAHTNGTSTATISKTFTATGAQSVQKCALFNDASSGTMHHALSFTQRSLQSGDSLAVTFTITLSANELEYLKTFANYAMIEIGSGAMWCEPANSNHCSFAELARRAA